MSGYGFSEEQVQRYARHIILPNVGGKGQRKLLDASALVIGAGGFGSPVGMYLAAAGIGKIGIVDDPFLGRHDDAGLPYDAARWPATAAMYGDDRLRGCGDQRGELIGKPQRGLKLGLKLGWIGRNGVCHGYLRAVQKVGSFAAPNN